jgi:adenylyl cyclase-associated protein
MVDSTSLTLSSCHHRLLYTIQVTKDQQTWRKEFKKPDSGLPMAPSLDPSKAPTTTAKKDDSSVSTVKKKKPLMGLPIFEYQDRGFKWVIENQTSDTIQKEFSKEGVLTVEISDPKQQVYLYNCDGAMVKVVGKFKSLVLDKCSNCSVVYDTLISSAEVVNCKKIRLQVTGLCPVFTIDKTINILVWLSAESLAVSAFTTSLSSEMNVSFPDGDDMKEVPIPEQFVHKIVNERVTSEVSDLYH